MNKEKMQQQVCHLIDGRRDGGNIHGVNEYFNIDSVNDCTKVLASFIINWCGVQRI